MAKKSILSICLLITLLVISSCVFAANDLGQEVDDSWNQTQNTFGNVGNTVGNVAASIGNGIGTARNDIMGNDAMGNDNNETAGITTPDTNNDYTAARTATTATNNNPGGLSNMAITWIILGITAAIISGLIWYYGTQNNETRVKSNNNE